MKYRCLVAEDNPIERSALELLLNKTERVEIVASCVDGLEAYRFLAEEDVDIVFSDVDMPSLSGLDLVKSLSRQPVFVFTTAHAGYAAESFDVDVADFIVKPILFQRLLHALNKAIAQVELKHDKQETLLLQPKDADGYILIRTANKMVKLHQQEIAYIESAGNFSTVFTINGESHLTLVNLKNIIIQLPINCMQRAHRQYMVNPQHIKSIELATVQLTGNYQVPLTNQYRQQVIDSLGAKIIQRTAGEAD